MRRTRIITMACLLLAGPALARAQQQPKLLRGFSVVLLLGETQGNAAPDGLSAAARKALADVKDFLPYKSYRVLDTQFLFGYSTKGRLRGLEAREYDFYVIGSSKGTGFPYAINVQLRTPDEDVSTPSRILASILIDTKFDIEVGETVVVGTSRVQGDKGLVVLLTAVPR